MELNVATLTVAYQGDEYQVEVIEPTDAVMGGMAIPTRTRRCKRPLEVRDQDHRAAG